MKKSQLGKKTDQNVGDSPHTGSDGYQENKAPASKRADKSSSGRGSNEDEYRPKLMLAGHAEPTYYIGGGNGNGIIEEIMNDLGWRRIKDKLDESFTLKWCELKQSINYNTFKEGDQLVNHIPNCNLLTNKLGLLNSLQEYSRVCGAMKKRVPKLDFLPETYKLDDPKEREVFKETWKEDEVWICKPTGRNQGKGIFLVITREEVDQLVQEADEKGQQQQQGKSQKPLNRIIQRYIHNPLLVENKKFDIRCYMLVANTTPFLVLYHKGYIRLSMFEYENKYENLAMHLTNQFIQKKDPLYKDVKEDTVMTMEKFNDHINDNFMEDKGLERDWVLNILPTRMKQIMTYCFNSVKHRLHAKTGYFDLYGFDFMIDDEMKVWLIEVNVNPCLATNCEVLKEVVPAVVRETLYIAVDVFDKARKGKAIMPCPAINQFEVIFQGTGSGSKTSRTASPTRQNLQPTRSQSISPVRRPRTISPSKEMTSQTADNYAYIRRGLSSVARPGMKPASTSTVLFDGKYYSGGVLTGGGDIRSGTTLGLAKSLYYQDRVKSSRTPGKHSEKTVKIEPKQSSRDSGASEKNKVGKSTDTRKMNAETKEAKTDREKSSNKDASSRAQGAVENTNLVDKESTKSTLKKPKEPGPSSDKILSKTEATSPKIVAKQVATKSQEKSPKPVPKEVKTQGGKSTKGDTASNPSKIDDKSSLAKTVKQSGATKTVSAVGDTSSKTGQNNKNSSNHNNSSKLSDETKLSKNSDDSGVQLKMVHADATKKKANKIGRIEKKENRGS